MKTTRTYVILEISHAAYMEIRTSLEKAGYQHAFHEDIDGRPVIDMQGLAVATERLPLPKDILVNGVRISFNKPEITYEQVVGLAHPNKPFWDGWTVTYRAKTVDNAEVGGILTKGKSIRVWDKMVFNVADTSNA